jgi:hypothetical protein
MERPTDFSGHSVRLDGEGTGTLTYVTPTFLEPPFTPRKKRQRVLETSGSAPKAAVVNLKTWTPWSISEMGSKSEVIPKVAKAPAIYLNYTSPIPEPNNPIWQYLDQYQSDFADLLMNKILSTTDLRVQLVKALLQTSYPRQTYAAVQSQKYMAINPKVTINDLRLPGIDPTLPINQEVIDKASRDSTMDAPTVTRRRTTVTGLLFPNRGYPFITMYEHPKKMDKRRACIAILRAFQPRPFEFGFRLPKRQYFASPQTLRDYVATKLGKPSISKRWWDDTKQTLARHKLDILMRQAITWHPEAAVIYWVTFYHWLHIFAPVETAAWKTLFPELTPDPNPSIYTFLELQHPIYARFFNNEAERTPADQFRHEKVERMYLGYGQMDKLSQQKFKTQHEREILDELRFCLNSSAVQEIERTLYLIDRESVQTPGHCPLADVLAGFLSDYKQAFF